MIFVTVGTTQFDDLIRNMDQLAASDRFGQDILCQIGNGKYVPEPCDYFRFAPSINPQINAAQLVVTHGGATTLQLIKEAKRFVALANTRLADDHQSSFLRHLSECTDLVWGRDPAQVGDLIEQALAAPLPKIHSPSLGQAIIADVYQEAN